MQSINELLGFMFCLGFLKGLHVLCLGRICWNLCSWEDYGFVLTHMYMLQPQQAPKTSARVISCHTRHNKRGSYSSLMTYREHSERRKKQKHTMENMYRTFGSGSGYKRKEKRKEKQSKLMPSPDHQIIMGYLYTCEDMAVSSHMISNTNSYINIYTGLFKILPENCRASPPPA